MADEEQAKKAKKKESKPGSEFKEQPAGEAPKLVSGENGTTFPSAGSPSGTSSGTAAASPGTSSDPSAASSGTVAASSGTAASPGTAPASPPAAGAPPQPGQGGLAQRRSRWESSAAAMRYITNLTRDDEVRVRDSDRATTIFLLLSTILTVLSLVVKPFAGMRLQLVLICDLLVGVMLIFYLANRFGIINTFTPRQALLTWQLMMGSCFLGIFMTINMAVIIALLIANTSIDIR